MIVKLTGKYTTRRGSPVRILCTDNYGDDPVIGIHDGEPLGWRLNGLFRSDGEESTLDLIEATPPPPSPLEAAARKVVDAWKESSDDAVLHSAILELERIINEQ